MSHMTGAACAMHDGTPMAFDELVQARRSVRAFTSRPVPREVLFDVLAVAARAPSNSNMQPWRVHLAAGTVKDALAQAISEAHRAAPDDHQPERPMFAPDMPKLYAERRQRFGQVFFGTLGIDVADAPARIRQSSRNFAFFDAPVVAFFTVDRRLEGGSWFDCGIFAQTFMLAAKARGIGTCAQIALTKYHAIVRRYLPIEEPHVVACGMSIGYPDERAREFAVKMPRIGVDEFATLSGF